MWEWNEALVGGSARGVRGGAWSYLESDLRSSHRGSDDPSSSTPFYGFRVASVPEPSAALLMILGGATWLLLRRRNGR